MYMCICVHVQVVLLTTFLTVSRDLWTIPLTPSPRQQWYICIHVQYPILYLNAHIIPPSLVLEAAYTVDPH